MKRAKPGSARARHRLALEGLRYLDYLYRIAQHLARDHHEAQDLVQEAYVRALDSYQLFRPGTNLKAWLSRILYNEFFDHYHRRKRWVSHNGPELDEVERTNFWEALPGSAPTPESQALNKELCSKLNEALSKIPEDFRAPVVLIDLGELSYREAAEILRCPLGTIRSRLSRGRKQLRKHIEGYMSTGIVQWRKRQLWSAKTRVS